MPPLTRNQSTRMGISFALSSSSWVCVVNAGPHKVSLGKCWQDNFYGKCNSQESVSSSQIAQRMHWRLAIMEELLIWKYILLETGSTIWCDKNAEQLFLGKNNMVIVVFWDKTRCLQKPAFLTRWQRRRAGDMVVFKRGLQQRSPLPSYAVPVSEMYFR